MGLGRGTACAGGGDQEGVCRPGRGSLPLAGVLQGGWLTLLQLVLTLCSEGCCGHAQAGAQQQPGGLAPPTLCTVKVDSPPAGANVNLRQREGAGGLQPTKKSERCLPS